MSPDSRPDLIARRALLTGALAAVALSARAAQPRSLAFEVLRNGRKIGEQSMTFDEGEVLTVKTLAEMAVKVGPVSLFRYRHEATERWRAGSFVGLQTRTDINGKTIQASARREGGAVRIQPAQGAEIVAPDAAIPFSHWNRRIGDAPLFNPQDGKLIKERAAPGGAGAATLADGSQRQVEWLVFRGELQIQDGYDQDAVWTALISRLKDGSSLVYRRL